MLNIFKVNRRKEKELAEELEFHRNESSKKINYLERELERKVMELEKLKTGTPEILFNPKQDSIIEKNLKEMRKENEILKSRILDIQKGDIFSLFTPDLHNYKIQLDKYFVSAKHKDIVENLILEGKEYVCQLTNEDIERFTQHKNYDEFKKMHTKFLEGKIDIETKILAKRGEKIGKIFNKHRKFLSYATEKNIEFMDQLKEYNFYVMLEENFKNEQIEEIVEKNQEYHSKFQK